MAQADLGIELVTEVFTSRFLDEIIPQGFPLRQEYLDTVEAVMRYLRGEDATLAVRIAGRTLLPEGPRFAQLADMDWAFGTSGIEDRARYLATLYLEDITDFIRDHIDPHFDLIRYAEYLCSYADTFDEIEEALKQMPSPIVRLTCSLLQRHLDNFKPTAVAFSIPFPGCLLAALQCGAYIKEHCPEVKILLGGGFANTEWRHLRETRLFNYCDFVTLDDGELPNLRLLRYLGGELPKDHLLRTFCLEDGKVRYIDYVADDYPPQVLNDSLPAPDFEGLFLDRYLSLTEMTNPMHRLWSWGRWNKMMMAHGCYWARCAFCDTSLDYIGRYDAPRAVTVVDRMERIMQQTGCSGFHFVDEALPPHLLRQVAEEIIRRRLQLSFWGNIRFEKAYTTELCQLLAQAGCVAVSGGLEVASDRLLKLMNKGVTIDQTVTAATHLRDAGIMVHLYLMYGFPTESLEETIAALDVVRHMFGEGIVQSAFWHRYAMTVHSPSGIHPENYSDKIDKQPNNNNPFCNNEVEFHYPFRYDLDAVGAVLRTATYNYMNGLALDRPAAKWFSHLLPHRHTASKKQPPSKGNKRR